MSGQDMYGQGNNGGDQASVFGMIPLDSAGVQMAVDSGRRAAEGFIARLINVRELRKYFAVSTDYVFNKLKLLLFPYFYHGGWQRSSIKLNGTNGITYPPPRADINAPDMYIPVMGFVTYIIICAMVAGFAGGFRPEMLGLVGTKAFICFATDIAFVWLGFYLLAPATQPFLDCAAFCGYVFVGVAINEFAELIGGKILLYPTLIFTWAGMSYFLMHTLKVIMYTERTDPDDSYGGYSDPYNGNDAGNFDKTMDKQTHRRYYLLFLALVQLSVMYFLAFAPAFTSSQGQPVYADRQYQNQQPGYVSTEAQPQTQPQTEPQIPNPNPMP